MKRFAVVALLACLALSNCSDDSEPQGEFTPERIVGNWFWQFDDTEVIVSMDPDGETGRYAGTIVTETGCACCGGQRILEFEWSDVDDAFIGRHLWGGCQHDENYWGEEGFLRITPIDLEQIVVRYLDTVSQEGWTWYRLD